MPKKTESTGSELDSYVGNLLVKAATKGSVTEDDIQIELKDVDVSDAQLNSIYRSLRDRGVEIVTANDDEDAALDPDDVSDLDDVSLDDDESDEDHDVKVAKMDAEKSSGSQRSPCSQIARSRNRARGIDASTVMLTGDPVRMYLKEIGKVDLLTAADEVDRQKIEAGLEASNKLEAADAGEIELTRAEMRRLNRVEQVGLEAVAGSYLCKPASGRFHRKALRWPRHAVLGPYPGGQPGPYSRGREV